MTNVLDMMKFSVNRRSGYKLVSGTSLLAATALKEVP